MSIYRPTDRLDLPAIDKEVQAFWEAENIFRRSIEERPADNTFVFYEGPPSANGKPGIHHVMARSVKDLFCRYQTMLGKRVERKGGWDTHGLPVELSVEKELGITKEDIGTKISVDDYNRACKETVMRYKDMWDDLTRKMGYWVDLENPYITFENEYIESVWWLLQQLWNKDLIYKGYTIQPYSPAAGTGLSTHELNQPGAYRDVKDVSMVAQFRVPRDNAPALYAGVDAGDVFFIAWTTTPWTLPSNTALAVGPKIDYVRVATYNPYTKERVNLVLAEALVGKWFKPAQAEADFDAYQPGDKVIPYKVTGQFKGSEFEGVRYEQLLPFVQPDNGDAFKVLLADFVTTSDGTGIVHIAPSFGADDKRVGDANGMGSLTLVDTEGKFMDNVGEFAGRYVKNYKDDPDYVDVNVDIAVKLKQENRAFNVAKYDHNYPHCWRTDKPILYYPLDSWFIKASAVKERMYELNQAITWKPASTGEGRFGKWLENLQDWNLSRSRYWGIPLPVWRTKSGSEAKCIGSMAELQQEIDNANEKLGLNQKMPKDLHRPYIDAVTLVSTDGQPMTRELDLIDVWFDSGSMPYAQLHYPFENKEVFARNFPADFIAEGVDQTRGWFYTLHAIATMVFDSVAYKTVVSNGLVQAKDGTKMSKRLGNAVEPFETLAKYGADATRWYMISNAAPWDNLRFDEQGIVEVQRKFFGTLYNTYGFFALYANIDRYQFGAQPVSQHELPEIDRWVISILNTLIQDVRKDYDNYEPHTAARRVQQFVENELSNWYVRLNRQRFWQGEMTTDKRAAYQTLYTCLKTVSQLMAPVAPFFAEWLYRNLQPTPSTARCSPPGESAGQAPSGGTETLPTSVHLSTFPSADDQLIDTALEQRMTYAQRISSLVFSLRKKENIRVRQPLQKVLIPVLDSDFRGQVEQVKDLILAEVNVKEIEYLTEDNSVLQKRIKPNFKTLGRRLGKNMKTAAQAIGQFTQADIQQLEKTGRYELVVGDETHPLTLEDFEITAQDIPGWTVASDGDLTVALDVTLTPELEAEGTARDLVKFIQSARKDSGFDVTDRIRVQVAATPEVEAAVAQFGDYVKAQTLANSMETVEGLTGGVEAKLEVGTVALSVEKV